MKKFTQFHLANYFLNIGWCLKAIKGYLIKPVSVSERHWEDANVNNFFPIKARELKFGVCYLRGKSAPLTNFQPNWTTGSKVSVFLSFNLQPVIGHSGGRGGQALVVKTTRIFYWINPLEFLKMPLGAPKARETFGFFLILLEEPEYTLAPTRHHLIYYKSLTGPYWKF